MENMGSQNRDRPRVLLVRGVDLVAQILYQLGNGRHSLVLIFTADGRAVGGMTAELGAKLGPEVVVLGCSSAGGFGFQGYDDDSTIVIAFPASHFRADAVWLSSLRQNMTLEWMDALRRLHREFPAKEGESRFGLLLIDGMSGREEHVTAAVDAALPDLLVIGGSAGDGLRFGRTYLAMNGIERDQSAVFCLIRTDFVVEEVIFDHFLPLGDTMVVTHADADARLIHEINAEPAGEEYARLIGREAGALSPKDFAENPLLERTAGRHFVRAITSITDDGSLKLLSAVESGTLLTIGRPESLTEGLRQRMQDIGPADLVLGFDCILRRLAIKEAGEEATLARLCQEFRIAGFNTYGEQHSGIHVNQTFVGLALLDQSGGAHSEALVAQKGAPHAAR